MEFDRESLKKCKITYRETWNEFRNALGSNTIKYYEMDKAKKYKFLSVLDSVLTYEKNETYLTRSFKELFWGFIFCRATKINNDEEIDKISLERFLPNKEYIKADNRFSPKGVEYLYLACKMVWFNKINSNAIKECALSEIRATNGDKIGLCKFDINYTKYEEKKIIDLTIFDRGTFQEIENEFEELNEKLITEGLDYYRKNGRIKKKKIENECRNKVEKILLSMYFKLLSEEIFKPVSGVDSEYEYAPFHCMAEYFKQLGFDGIIYKSTVCNNEYSKNIVLFDKSYAIPKSCEFIDINY